MFKKFLSLFLSFCVLSSFVSMNMFLPLVCAAESADEEKALIPDDNLRAALRKELRKSEKST